MLPFRLDYVVKVSTLRRLGGVRLGLETVGLSIVSLGLVDAVAMLPLAVAAIATERRDLPRAADRRAALLPRLYRRFSHSGRDSCSSRSSAGRGRLERIFNRVGDHASISRSTFAASSLVFCCWTTRAIGSALLLSSLGVFVVADPGTRHPLHGRGGVDSADSPRAAPSSASAPRPASCLRSASAQDAAINFSLASGMLLTVSALGGPLSSV